MGIDASNSRKIVIFLFIMVLRRFPITPKKLFNEPECPMCQEGVLKLEQYDAHCSHCSFSIHYGKPDSKESREKSKSDLIPSTMRALTLLGAHSGKVLLVYGALKKIPGNTADIKKHPDFNQAEYLALLEFFNQIAVECEDIINKSPLPSLSEFMGRG